MDYAETEAIISTEPEIDLAALRSRLRQMTDEQLIRWGDVVSYMCSARATVGKKPEAAFLIKQEEVRAEWRRRIEQKRKS